MSFQSALLATTAFLAVSNAHIMLQKPVPYSLDKLDNSPITKAQYPCKVQNGFTVSTMNQMKVGESQTVQFKGTAVHGGGSCQLSVTLDTEPTANSKFKVIKSIEGGCPGVSGSTNTYNFTLPDSIPNGKASFAWSWFSKLSGQPEMYMNCAPIEVTGGASDDSKFNELPDMLIANLDDTCTSPQNFATKYPNPGSDVQNGGTNDLKPPTGSGCGSSGSGDSTPASSGAAQPSSAPSSTAATGEGATSAAGGGATSPATSADAPSNTGGVFAPGASSAAGGASTTTRTTLQTVTGSPSTPAGTGSTTSPTGSPSSGGSACSENGAIVCNGTDKFGICDNGNVVWQAVAPGTTCSNGAIQKRGYNGRIARPRAVLPRAVVPGKDFTPEN